VALGGGWYLVKVQGTPDTMSASRITIFLAFVTYNGSTGNFAGDGSSGFIVGQAGLTFLSTHRTHKGLGYPAFAAGWRDFPFLRFRFALGANDWIRTRKPSSPTVVAASSRFSQRYSRSSASGQVFA
jgi:hypothetical protein